MTRSRRRKLMREGTRKSARAVLKYLPAVSFALAGGSAFAQQEPSEGALQEIVVTAQKRAENLQNVPISIQALGEQKLEQMNVKDFDDYAKLMPSLTFQTTGPGYNQVIIRGVSSGGTGYDGPQSTVGTYLDEQPVTTNAGTMDVHIYDIARIEVLSGPQGTLYGASSEAGTLRIITNQPDASEFKAAYDVQGSYMAHGGAGEVVEGFVNIPLSSTAAVRIVGWQQFTPGYINDVAGTRVFPTSGACIANFSPPPAGCVTTPDRAHNHYNDVQTTGARAALKLDLDENWTVKAVVMGQDERSRGYAGSGYNPLVGPLEVTHFYPQEANDNWYDTALTVEGKVSNLDLVYTGAFLKRDQLTHADYSDYSLAYDSSESPFITNNAGKLINPSQRTTNRWYYQKWNQEFRVTTPKDNRLRFVGGLFVQRQQTYIENDYQIPGLAQDQWVPGFPNTWWLSDERLVDRDSAVFGELSYDILPKLTATVGGRYFKYDNTQQGFFGLSAKTDALLGSPSGVAGCFAPGGPGGIPCTNLNKRVDDTGHIPKVNLTYHISDSQMVYATWAQGFRPGGINRVGTLPEYKADKLTSYEIGWKTSWAGDKVRFNGALFDEQWKNYQFTFEGPSGLALYANAGQAEVKGLESSLEWAATGNLTLSSGIALLNPKLTQNYCGQLDANGNPVTNCATPLAPAGTQLPNASKFKGNMTARYLFRVAQFDAHVQGSLVYQSSTWPALRIVDRILGQQPAYALADFTAGLDSGKFSTELFVNNAFDRLAQFSRYSECGVQACGPFGTYVIPAQPRTVGVRFGQKF